MNSLIERFEQASDALHLCIGTIVSLENLDVYASMRYPRYHAANYLKFRKDVKLGEATRLFGEHLPNSHAQAFLLEDSIANRAFCNEAIHNGFTLERTTLLWRESTLGTGNAPNKLSEFILKEERHLEDAIMFYAEVFGIVAEKEVDEYSSVLKAKSEAIERLNGRNFVLKSTGASEVASIAIAYGHQETAVLQELVTHPKYRRRGLAAKLVGIVLQWAGSNNLQRVFVEADEDSGAIDLYKGLRFTELRRQLFLVRS